MPHPRPTQLQGITDLTLFADVKPGLIEGIFDSRSYGWRLQRVLELLDTARRASREADVFPSPFIDAVARLRGIHFFRFAILRPENRLFLNVTFDGGWEPYMRIIWGPLGTMLDLIFCHCEGYPLAAASSFDHYTRWVREHEVPSQFFYADSGGSAADRAYLNRLEKQQRTAGDRPDADLRAAQLALQPMRPPQPTAATVNEAFRALKVLYGMTQFFGLPGPASPDSVALDDGSALLRFAQEYLSDLRDWFAQGLIDPGQQFDALRSRFERERLWLMSPRWTRPSKRDPLQPLNPGLLQAGIVHSPKAPGGRFARGALVLARVIDPGLARQWLKSSAEMPVGQTSSLISDGRTLDLVDGRVVCTVAITYPGLKTLGVHEDHLASLPAEFVQGMEARAGILGDLRINHPQQWNRPRAWGRCSGSQQAPIDLPLVHLVIQLRTCEADDEQEVDRSQLLPRLDQWIADNLVPSRSIEVLAVEPAWSRPREDREPAARDHFGYVDGVSQPVLTPSAGNLFWDDAVKTGELLLGWVNDRGDGPLDKPGGTPERASPPWLDLGTFLVVRKIRQHVERFDGIVDKAADALWAAGAATSISEARELVRAKLMGRRSDGGPLMAQRGPGANDFDYRYDADGAQCPFASHVRRANPRTAMALGRPPRIVRRGMSYGPPSDQPHPQGRDQDERGVLFMAYNASIAEQFEVIQRWLTGGNSSGVSSSQPDPFLGVPRVAEPTVFRFAHGDKVIRIDLGDQPICRLEWGLYAFVPSMGLLRDLDALVSSPDGSASDETSIVDEAPHVDETPAEALERVKAEFEDDLGRGARWARVRRKSSGVERIGSRLMVGSFSAVMQVLKDPGSTYSVSGYGDRMKATLGPSPFGQDDVGPYRGHDRAFVGAVKEAIASAVTEEQAYATAFAFTKSQLATQLAGAKAMGLPGASVDFVELGAGLVAALCKEWFGVAYGDGVAEVGGIDPRAEPVRCPGHFLAMARNVFSADPNATVRGLAARQAPALRLAVAKWVAAAENAAPAPVLSAVLNAMDKVSSDKDIDTDERNGTVANVMLGLPATLLGTWGKVLRQWTANRELWRLQLELSLPPETYAVHSRAIDVLRKSLITTMAADPVADGVWRRVVQPAMLGAVKVDSGDVVWLGIGSALAEGPGDLQVAEDLLFGGSWRSKSDRDTLHACPGRGLAIGALLGALAAWLLAGEWAATASPTTLSLKPTQA